MNHFFHVNGPVFTFLSKFCDVLIISILWTLFCLPVVTVGPACAALYHTVHKSLLKSDGYILPTFWKSFCSSLKQGILLTLLCLFISVFCVLSYFFIAAEGQSQIFVILYFALLILAAFLLLVLLMYSFPILSRFYMRFSVIFKTSVALAVTRIGFTLLLAVIFLLCAVTMFVAPFTLFFLPACYAMAAERLIEPGFQKVLKASALAEHPSKSPAPGNSSEDPSGQKS